MKMNRLKTKLSFFLCIMLIVATALTTTGCNDKKENGTATNESVTESTVETVAESVAETVEEAATDADEEAAADGNVLGEGSTKFMLSVVDKDGNEETFEVHTDKATVGEALLELNFIAGDDSEYGLYVKTVNGITADYDKDGVYWAFYINGEYAQTGVDSTNIAEGDSYSFKVE